MAGIPTLYTGVCVYVLSLLFLPLFLLLVYFPTIISVADKSARQYCQAYKDQTDDFSDCVTRIARFHNTSIGISGCQKGSGNAAVRIGGGGLGWEVGLMGVGNVGVFVKL